MNGLKFRLYGKTAFFKKPDVNSFVYFTYNNIHKIALLGLLGSIIGFSGYSLQYDFNKTKKDNNMDYPEFYDKLKDFKLAIVPISKGGGFPKKIQQFNNGVGYASREEGGNLIVREQWLENPCWEIYILENGSLEYKKINEYLISSKCVFMPYLGKNDHIASIDQVEEVLISTPSDLYIDSLFPYTKDVEIGTFPKNDEDDIVLFREVSPISLNKDYNFYEFVELMYTNLEVINIDTIKNVYSCNEKNLVFI
ncbi:UNVERIFIED_CONTAM: CRISPR-associated protein Cas5h [Acetivibrio alkalicellulosi]